MLVDNNDLPAWYVLRREKLHEDIDFDELLIYGKKRIEKLANLNSIDQTERFHQPEDFIGHLVLRITAAITEDKIFTNWFVEKEGDLFQKMFDNETFSVKINILKDLFNGEFYIDIKEIASTLNLNTNEEQLRILVGGSLPLRKKLLPSDILVAVKYYYVPRLLRERLGYIKHGWLVAPLRLIRGDVKGHFQKKLRNKINALKEKLIDDEKRSLLFKEMAEEIFNYWKKTATSKSFYDDNFFSEEKKLYTQLEYYPPCMKDLISKLRTTGYLSHSERLQLGLFLKRLGMSLDEQLEFWYKNAVDNIGISRDEFEKKAGYIIRHIYGLEGSRKDYEAPKCETVINRYYCFFSSNDLSSIKTFLKEQNIGKSVIDNIIEEVRNRDYRSACSKFLSGKFNVRYKKPMSHPLLFFRIAYRSQRKREIKIKEKNLSKNPDKPL